jgi:putative NIF3 family GTP cyclohydrolase 1 type 2
VTPKLETEMRASELHDWLAREAPPHTPEDEVDGIMAGDPTTEVRGVAVTWLPNLAVLEQAAAAGLNFVLAHEPVYYHHPYFYPYGDDRHYPALDLPEKIATPAAQRKKKLIEDHGLVVYRFHDGWDQYPEYGMGYALARKLGWSDAQVAREYIYELTPTSLAGLAAEIASKLGKSGIRYVGDPDLEVRRVSLDWGSPGAIDIVTRAQRHGCQAALTGECLEWRDAEYARDSGLALITGGHCATETPGMEACRDWLAGRFPQLPVQYIDTVDPDRFA